MLEENKIDFLCNVFGYQYIKQELSLVKNWLINKNILTNPKITLPKGVLFYGPSGCGKTLFMREFSNSFSCPKFIIEGKKENISNEIIDIFKKARNEEFSLILIDEIDLLIGENPQVTRTLQQELDGVNSKNNFFVLATTNSLNSLSQPLLRPGRFDKQILVTFPDRETRKSIFKKFLLEYEINVDNLDLDYISKISGRCSGAQIKAVINDLFLRVNKNAITEDLEYSVKRIIFNNIENSYLEHKNLRVAYHEAGHALMALRFKENWSFYQAIFNATGAETRIYETKEQIDNIEKREQSIMIGLSGYLSERIFYKKHDIGSFHDFEEVNETITKLVERSCITGFSSLIPTYTNNRDRYESNQKRRKNEMIVQKLSNKYIKEARKWLIKHKNELDVFAHKMYDNGKVTWNEANELFPNLAN